MTTKVSTYCILRSMGHIHQEMLSKNKLRFDQHIVPCLKAMVCMGHGLDYKDDNDHKDLKVEPRYFVSFWTCKYNYVAYIILVIFFMIIL